MLTDYVILTAVTAALTILWRTFKSDHPAFKQWLLTVPFFGNALSCGICLTFWFSLVAISITNPFRGYVPSIASGIVFATPVVAFFMHWLALGMGVLLTRTLAIVLLELGATLKHRHELGHANSK